MATTVGSDVAFWVSRTILSAVAPTPTPPAAGADYQLLVQLAVRNFVTVVSVFTLVAYYVVALGVVYLLMYLVKVLVKAQLPEHYRKVLGLVLWVLTVAAGGAGYWLGGPGVALVVVLGGASSALLHDWLDGVRAWKRLAVLEERSRSDLEDDA